MFLHGWVVLLEIIIILQFHNSICCNLKDNYWILEKLEILIDIFNQTLYAIRLVIQNLSCIKNKTNLCPVMDKDIAKQSF